MLPIKSELRWPMGPAHKSQFRCDCGSRIPGPPLGIISGVPTSEWGANICVCCFQVAVQRDVPVPRHGAVHGQNDLWLGQKDFWEPFSPSLSSSWRMLCRWRAVGVGNQIL